MKMNKGSTKVPFANWGAIRTTILHTLAGLGLLIGLGGAALLVGYILNPEQAEALDIIRAIVTILIGSFIYLLCAGKLRRPLYILIPISFIGSLLTLIAITSKQYIDTGYTMPLLLIGLMLCAVFPLIALIFIERYYRHKGK